MAVCSGTVISRRGFSLIELLVALALLSVVVLIMGLLLNSMRINSEALLEGFSKEGAAAPDAQLAADFRMLLRTVPDEETPVMGFDDEGALRWRRMIVDETGRELPAEVQVFQDDRSQSVLRVLTPSSGVSTTNVVWRSVDRMAWRFWDGSAWQTTWPPEEHQNEAVPRLVRADLLQSGGENVEADFLVPSAMRYDPDPP
jgi:prepilin-type N-terminal cleavage/methylation domain-containing protein